METQTIQHTNEARTVATPARTVRPSSNVSETTDSYILELLVPGVGRDGVELEVEQGMLTFKGFAAFAAPEGLELRHREFDSVSFERSFRLPDDVDNEGIQATLSSGVLRITLPKKAAAQARKIAITD